ncbi:hypothetical protein [Halofilum ochraceum]|uniref:hypothetical protein n=1 Tax=Halofilum ochraceum TaxID=1611323 RepID=UPI0008DAC7E3|nr:hypothetical protein [Halofilum ochraceum]
MTRARRRGQGRTQGAPRGALAQQRAEVARVAARLMAEEGVHGFSEAKARAADQLGIQGRQALPRNDEVESEIRAWQALFQADEQPVWLARMRRTALDAMDLLTDFTPHLAGSVLRGTAPQDAEVTLHLFTEPPERVATFLLDRGIPWELDAWVGRFGRGEVELPMYRIMPGGQPVRLIVFPIEGPREAPRSPVDGKPMARANRARVAELLAAEDPENREEPRMNTNGHE